MNVIERQRAILELLKTKEFLTVEELVDCIGASKATIRRDLKQLELEQGSLKRFRGGAALDTRFNEDSAFRLDEKLLEFRDEKRIIGEKAAALISDGDFLFLDSGSTVHFMIDYITAKDISVVTNGIENVIKLLEKGIQTYILEGYVQPGSKSVQGHDTVSKIHKLNFDKAFLGTRGIDTQIGFSTTNSYDGLLKAAAIQQARKTYVLGDSSKFGIRKFYTFAGFDEVELVTDRRML
jgi:DeoR family fructose operon transcriptional repressor